jgi:hypothetical protein
MKKLRSLVWIPMALAVAACGDSSGPSGGGCDEPVTMTIGSGTTPTFDWSPACTVAQVTVTEIGAEPPDDLMWAVLADQNVIKPPVQYGSTPSGAVQIHAPAVLTKGKSYLVGLAVHDQTSGELVVQVQQQFTP